MSRVMRRLHHKYGAKPKPPQQCPRCKLKVRESDLHYRAINWQHNSKCEHLDKLCPTCVREVQNPKYTSTTKVYRFG